MDTEYMIKAVKEFFETAIVTNSNGTFTLEEQKDTVYEQYYIYGPDGGAYRFYIQKCL